MHAEGSQPNGHEGADDCQAGGQGEASRRLGRRPPPEEANIDTDNQINDVAGAEDDEGENVGAKGDSGEETVKARGGELEADEEGETDNVQEAENEVKEENGEQVDDEEIEKVEGVGENEDQDDPEMYEPESDQVSEDRHGEMDLEDQLLAREYEEIDDDEDDEDDEESEEEEEDDWLDRFPYEEHLFIVGRDFQVR